MWYRFNVQIDNIAVGFGKVQSFNGNGGDLGDGAAAGAGLAGANGSNTQIDNLAVGIFNQSAEGQGGDGGTRCRWHCSANTIYPLGVRGEGAEGAVRRRERHQHAKDNIAIGALEPNFDGLGGEVAAAAPAPLAATVALPDSSRDPALRAGNQ